MQDETGIAAVAHVIELAIAPVFLLSGIGAMLAVMTNRLARVIDRARALEMKFPPGAAEQSGLHAELGTLVATAILVAFAFAGEFLLATLGISLAALRVSGGILLLLIGIEMVFARTSGSTSTTEEEAREATTKPDVSVFPLATP